MFNVLIQQLAQYKPEEYGDKNCEQLLPTRHQVHHCFVNHTLDCMANKASGQMVGNPRKTAGLNLKGSMLAVKSAKIKWSRFLYYFNG